jgi:sulfotransferase
MEIFFNSSMPRSGSTLLQNILGNNPDIYATPTSGLFDMLNASKKIYTQAAQFKAQNESEMKLAFVHYCRYGLHGYFEGITDKKYSIDKSRAWGVNMGFLKSFYQNPKVICMVRDLRDVITSMEKNYRKFPERFSQSPDKKEIVTVGQRVTSWMQHKPVGSSLINLKEIINVGNDKDILFIKFEDLTLNPDAEIRKVYEYLNIPYYKHDFDNILQVTFEDDKFHGIYGDHIIKNKVEPVPSYSKELLGEIICENLYKKNQWYFDYFNYKPYFKY